MVFQWNKTAHVSPNSIFEHIDVFLVRTEHADMIRLTR